MITFDNFKHIHTEVGTAIDQLLDFIEARSKDYILFLANGEYKDYGFGSRLNPYGIDWKEDIHRDMDRREFFSAYMETNYSFPNKSSVAPLTLAIQLELMIYCHIWESKAYLRTLKRLALLVDGASYPWSVEVPLYKKEDFIRNDIREKFSKKDLFIAQIMKNGFHTSLRNAFAHSDYVLSYSNKRIDLLNYGGSNWELKNISFQEWTKRFAYSALLSHNLLMKLQERRQSLVSKYGTDEFIIVFPKSEKVFTTKKIYYDVERDAFSFYKHHS